MPNSLSVGIIKDLPSYLQASLTLQRIQRAPRALELFASGPDDSEKTFKIGNPNLTLETANTAEIGLKRTRGDIRFDANMYYTRMTSSSSARRPATPAGRRLRPAPRTAAATISRSPTLSAMHLSRRRIVVAMGCLTALRRHLRHRRSVRMVRATFTDGSNVPRIPPMRLGGGVYWRSDNWYARLNLLHAFKQNDFAQFDTATDGYNLLKLQIETGAMEGFTVGPRRIGYRVDRRQSSQRRHPQFRPVPQGRDPAAGP